MIGVESIGIAPTHFCKRKNPNMNIHLLHLVLVFISSLSLLIIGRRNEYSRWTGILLLVGGSISVTYLIHDTVVPALEGRLLTNPVLGELLYWISIPGVYIHFYFLGYAFFASALYFADFLPGSIKKAATLCFLVPIPLIILVSGDFHPPIEVNLVSLRFLAHLYTVLGVALYLYVVWDQRGAAGKYSRYPYIAILFAYMLAENVNYYSIRKITIDASSLTITGSSWNANVIFVLAACLLFLGIVQGIWGIRLRLEREKHDYSLRTITVGTSILNHTIKNEVQKIHYMCERTTYLISQSKLDSAEDLLQDIKDVSNHLLQMTERIKEKSDDVLLKERWFPVSELLESTADVFRTVVDERIRVITEIKADGLLYADESHTREVIGNLCHNAIDAMKETHNGTLTLRAFLSGRRLVLEIQDSGEGIHQELQSKIFEPFFTTKQHRHNYGLGLSYCYNVMRKHGGSIRLAASAPNAGTTFALTFPVQRFRAAAQNKEDTNHFVSS